MKELIEKIVNKEFESVINGYSPTNVDIFLDSIINELEKIQIQINEMKNQNEELKNKIKKLEEANAILSVANKPENDIVELDTDIIDDLNEQKKDEN